MRVGWAKRSVPTATLSGGHGAKSAPLPTTTELTGGHASLCPPYKKQREANMTSMFSRIGGMGRRDFLRAGFGSLAFGAFGALTRAPAWAQTAAHTAQKDRILVVVELSGGNDGLNTVVPYGDDAYYRARPRIGIKPARLRKLDDHFGFQYTMAGLERLYKDGHMAIVHGVGYEQPSFSHFSSMAYWQTAAPNRGDLYGWVGRMADAMDPEGHANYIVNVDTQQSLAVRAQKHVALVFDDPQKFVRTGFADETGTLTAVAARSKAANEAQDFLFRAARSTPSSSSGMPGRSTARRSTMASCGSASIAWRRSLRRNSRQGFTTLP